MSISSYVSWPHICLLLKIIHSYHSPTFGWVGWFVFLVNLFQFFVDSGYQPFVRWVDYKNFFPFYWLPVHSIDCFAVQKLWSLIGSHLSILAFCCQCYWCFSHEVLAYAYVLNGLPRFSSRVFMVLGLMFKSLIHLELILV